MRMALFRVSSGLFLHRSFCRHTSRADSDKRCDNQIDNAPKIGVVLACYKDHGKFSLLPESNSVVEKTGADFLKSCLQRLFKSGYPKKDPVVIPCAISLDNNEIDVAITGLTNPAKQTFFDNENLTLEEREGDLKELIRSSIAGCTTRLRDLGCNTIYTETFGFPEAAAEGSVLSVFAYDELKRLADQRCKPVLRPLWEFGGEDEGAAPTGQDGEGAAPAAAVVAWHRGHVAAEAQNVARKLMETPANVCTPRYFAQTATDILAGWPNVRVHTRDKEWIESENMNGLLAVARGAVEPPVFLEIEYRGGGADFEDDGGGRRHACLVGKGVTFDAGGISIKPAAGMERMKCDMGGAAVVLATVYALAKLQSPVNLTALIPLCENLPDGAALRPGDVIRLRSGHSVEVTNTDAEGRLLLADALHYAMTGGAATRRGAEEGAAAPPGLLVDVATLTGAMVVALGSAYTGFFSQGPRSAARELRRCGQHTGDRVWQMPSDAVYRRQMRGTCADLVNAGVGAAGAGAGACTAHAFLSNFVHVDKADDVKGEAEKDEKESVCGASAANTAWLHLDMAGMMGGGAADVGYLGGGWASGRPTRTLVKLLDDWGRRPSDT